MSIAERGEVEKRVQRGHEVMDKFPKCGECVGGGS